MAQTFRHPEILRIAREEGRVTVEGLAARLGVTVQTIRRDLGDLAREGRIERVHGGAVAPDGPQGAIGYDERRGMAAEAKAAIARACAAQIAPGTTLFLDIGTTAEAVARALLGHAGLTVATSNINVATILAANEDCEVIVIGGVLRRSDGGLVGDLAASIASRLKLELAVISCSALDADGDMLEFDVREVQATRAVMERARATWLVCDSGKLGRHAPARLGSVEEIDALFIESAPPGPLADICRRGGTRVVTPG